MVLVEIYRGRKMGGNVQLSIGRMELITVEVHWPCRPLGLASQSVISEPAA